MTEDKKETEIPSLDDFLKTYRLSQQDKINTKITHTALPNPGVKSGGSYNIPVDKMEAFYQVYYNDVFMNNKVYHLTEAHHQEVSPILIDLDFRQTIEDNQEIKKLYTDEDIKTYLKVFHEVLSKYIDEEHLKELEVAYVMEKKNASKAPHNQVKDGVHIIYPNLCPSYKIQFLARHDMIKHPEIQELFKKMNLSNDIRNVIDLSFIRANNWFMYGSGKPNSEPYKITNIYDMSYGECVPVPMKNPDKCSYKMFKNLLISYKKDLTPIKFGIEDSVKEKYESMPNEDKDNIERKLNRFCITNPKYKNKIDINKNKIDDKDFEFADRLVKECLSDKRATNYEDWIRVCWCLSNIDYRLEEAFIEFSRKALLEKFNEEESRNEWNRANTRIMECRLGVGTLHKWAKEDNQMKYNDIKREQLSKLMFNSTNQTHTDVARYIYEKYKYEFKCSSISHGRWYYYNNHRWVLNERGNELKKKMSYEVVQDYNEYETHCKNKADEIKEEGAEKDSWQVRSKKSFELVSKLKKHSYKNPVFTECQELFFDADFEYELDSNNDLLHFNNGVYDLNKKEFREGYLEDNISLSTNINFIEQPTEEDNEKIKQVEELINKILPIERVRNYILNLLASFLHGENKEQKFHFWTGSGSNGKSTLIDFYKKIIGDYYGSMPITALTQGRGGAETASPVFSTIRGKRFISFEENENVHDFEIKVGFLRQLTGNNEITARKLCCHPITFKPQFKIVYICNELPQIPSDDDGTWRRIRVVEFVSKFCENPNPSKPYEFTIDRELSNKLDEWKEVFMYILIQYYQNSYRVNGIIEPEEVLRNTNSYRNDSDIYSQFINETLIEEPTSSFGIDDIFPKFKSFLQSNSFDTRKYTRRELEKNLNKLIGKCNIRKKWKGYKLRDLDNDSDDDDNKTRENINLVPPPPPPKIHIVLNQLFSSSIIS
jgi:P4 family phage/plasmid primase-like protien